MAELWCTHDLPGIRWDPEDEPDDYDDELLDEARAPYDLRRQGIRGGTRIHTLNPSQEYL